MNHATIELLLADYRGLRGLERDEVDAHVASCASCAARLAEYRAMDVDLQSLQDAWPDPQLRENYFAAVRGGGCASSHRPEATRPGARWRYGFAIAAATFIIALALWIVQYPEDTEVEKATGPIVVPSPAVSSAITELNFQCDAITNLGALTQLIASFETQNPDIDVRFLQASVSGVDEASYNAAVRRAAETADVFCAMPSPAHLENGILRDLAPFIAADPSFRPDDFYPGLLAGWGETTGPIPWVPTYFDLGFIAYKPTAFDEASLPYPRPGWTWDDFLAAAVQLTQRRGDEVVRWGFSEIGTGVLNRRLMSAWSLDWQAGPDYATLADVLAWYEMLYVRTGAAPVPVTLGWEQGKSYHTPDDLDLYRSGNKSAMWDASWFGTAQTGPRVPYPEGWPGEPQLPMNVLTGLVMSGQTAHPEASWRWISYLSQHLPNGEYLPARRSLALRANFWWALDPVSVEAYRYGLEHLGTFPQKFPPDYAAQMKAVVAVVKGEKTAEQALADLVAQGHVRSAVPSGWQREGDEALDVQFLRPQSWEMCQATELSRLFCEKTSPGESPLAPPVFYITLLPPGFMNEDATAYNGWSPDTLAAAFGAEIGGQFTSPHAPAGYNTYTRLPDVTVDGFTGAVVEGEPVWEAPAGTKDRRVLIRLGDAVCVLGTYYVTEAELRTFEQVVTSFQVGPALRARASQSQGR